MKKQWMATAALGLTLVAGACSDELNDDGVLARVGNYALTVDQAVGLLADEERLAADAGVVESLAELWLDYTLLAEAAVEDSTFSNLDLQPLVEQQLAQRMVFQLRDSVIQVDTFVTDEELRLRYEAEAPAVEVRARHIMLRLPIQSTQAQFDSVQAQLEAIRVRALGGEAFETLALQFSQDPGTSRNGGDLGFFQRGEMVAPFEEATLALQPGEMSDVVETPMGLHLIRLDERRVRGFEEAAPVYRRQVQSRMVQEAESLYVAAIISQVEPVPTEGALEVVREIASNPGATLSGRAERRALIEWETGDVTVGDIREFLQLEAPLLRDQLVTGTDEEVEDFLQSVARRDLLVRAAESEGLRPPADSIQGLVEEARTQLKAAARVLGLFDLDQAPGEAVEIAVSRAVQEALLDNLSGATQIVPLGIVSFQLRDGRSTAVLEEGVGAVIVDVAQIRAARSLSPVEQTLDSAIASADTVGG
jgi:hypothetical protein